MTADRTSDMYSGQDFESANKGAQLSARVAAHLREQILSGKLQQGQFLRIDAIAKALGISMTPVREGLLMLQSESFVRLKPRRGFVVNAVDKQDLRDLFWAQATIGAELASRAATRMPEEEISRLEELQDEYKAAIEKGDQEREDRLGHEFHRRINLAAESTHLALLLGSLVKRLRIRFYSGIEGQLGDALEYHPLILKAIRQRDSKTAASLMFTHIYRSADHLIAMLERQGMWSDAAEEAPARSD